MTVRRGVTLMEMLAVVAILGAAMTLMFGLANPLRGAHSAIQTESAIAGAVARARLIAQVDGGAELIALGGTLTVSSDSRSARISLGSDWNAAIEVSGKGASVDSIELDGAGRSVDYEIQLTDRAGFTRILTVLGLSGQVFPDKEGTLQ